jgi:hypothetical protein
MTKFNEKENRAIAQLEKLKQIQPDFDYLESFGKVLKTKISIEKSFTPNFSFYVSKFFKLAVTATLTIILISGFGWGVVLATQKVSPGTLFYPVKLAGEKLQLEISKNDPRSRADLRTKFANNRLVEIKVLEENNSLDEEKLKKVFAQYNSEIYQIQEEISQIVDYRNGETLSYLLSLEDKLKKIISSFNELAPVLGETESYTQAINLSSFIQEVISQKIFDYEKQNQLFGEDKKKWQRALIALSQLSSKLEIIQLEFNQSLSAKFGTKAVEFNESGELNISPSPEKDQKIYNQLISIKTDLNKLSGSFQEFLEKGGSDEDLIRFIKALNSYENQLAELEILLK